MQSTASKAEAAVLIGSQPCRHCGLLILKLTKFKSTIEWVSVFILVQDAWVVTLMIKKEVGHETQTVKNLCLGASVFD